MNHWSRSDIPGRLSRLLTDARFLADPERDEEAAPFWNAGMPEGGESGLEGLRERFQNRLRRKTELRQQWGLLEERRSELESDRRAREHFESVTGHRVADFDWRKAPNTDTAAPGTSAEQTRTITGFLPIRRIAGVACLLLMFSVLAVLGLTPRPSDPFSTETSSLSGYRWDEVGERTRRFHATNEEDPAGAGAVSYAAAISQARRSRTVLFGFMERYDREGLLLARDMLDAARSVDTGYPEPVQVERMTEVLDSLIMRTY